VHRRADGPLSPEALTVPPRLREVYDQWFGEAGLAWIDALPALAAGLLHRWSLRLDGPTTHGAVAWVLPVRREDDTLAVLKLQYVDDETAGEPAALRAWAGRGAVRLLEHDAASGSMLLERLDAARSLDAIPDDQAALETLSELLARLSAVPAPPGLRRLDDIVARLLDRVPAAVRTTPEELGTLLDRCAAVVREVAGEPAGDRLLHWDLHFQNVLAPLPDGDTREPWLAIDPKPLSGDPGFELLPALHNRWDDVVAAGDVARAVRRRFDLMTEVVGLDRAQARAWTLGRVLENLLWEAESGVEIWSAEPDRAVARILLG
jgi:streptomycin 6-kinase